MKTFINITNSLLIVSILLLTACGGDGDPSPQQEESPQGIALKKLTSSSWKVSSITRDGTDVTQDFAGFTINFTSSGFTANNGGTAWDDSGSWSWNDAAGTSIKLGNDIIVQIAFSNDDTQLTLTFNIPVTTLDIGRTQSLAGSYVVVLGK